MAVFLQMVSIIESLKPLTFIQTPGAVTNCVYRTQKMISPGPTVSQLKEPQKTQFDDVMPGIMSVSSSLLKTISADRNMFQVTQRNYMYVEVSTFE